MTQDEIIHMAREAGIGALTEYGKEALERFAALVAAHECERIMNEPLTKAMWERFESEVRTAEREACAKVCDGLHHWAASCCAKDIRARGDK